MAEQQADGVFAAIPDEQYHASVGSLSVSGAKLLLPPSCPAKFRWQQDNVRKPKKVWDFGHVAHHLVLGEGAQFTVLDPAVCGLNQKGELTDGYANTSSWKNAVKAARADGLVPIKVDDYAIAEDMAAAVRDDPIAGPLFEEGQAETSLYATHPESGVQLRGRTDWLTPTECIDFKTSTTANPAELERKFWQLGYFMQARWYLDLLAALGRPAEAFKFVVVEKEPPHLVTVIEYDDAALEAGRRENRRAVELFAQCTTSGEWPGYASGVVTLSLPRWALRDAENAVIQEHADELIAELEGIYQA